MNITRDLRRLLLTSMIGIVVGCAIRLSGTDGDRHAELQLTPQPTPVDTHHEGDFHADQLHPVERH